MFLQAHLFRVLYGVGDKIELWTIPMARVTTPAEPSFRTTQDGDGVGLLFKRLFCQSACCPICSVSVDVHVGISATIARNVRYDNPHLANSLHLRSMPEIWQAQTSIEENSKRDTPRNMAYAGNKEFCPCLWNLFVSKTS